MNVLDLLTSFLFILVWIFIQVASFLLENIIGLESSQMIGGNLGLLILLTIVYLAWDAVSSILKYALIIGWALAIFRILVAILFTI